LGIGVYFRRFFVRCSALFQDGLKPRRLDIRHGRKEARFHERAEVPPRQGRPKSQMSIRTMGQGKATDRKTATIEPQKALHLRRRGASSLLLSVLLLAACQTTSTVDVLARPRTSGPITLSLSPCTDRTGTKGRDLALEATQAFQKALSKTNDFVIAEDGRFRLSCEVTDFREGSAFQRWLLPGTGQTAGKVAAMVMDAQTGETQTIVVGEARVSSGGLYTIGADSYIVPSAVDEVIQKLRAWARGEIGGGIFPRQAAYAGRAKTGAT